MANIVTVQPIRYGQSRLSTTVTGLLKTKPGNELALSNLKSVDGFRISGSQPAGTDRRVAFLLDDLWYRIEPDGSLLELMDQNITVDNVLYSGNTTDELEGLTGIPDFLNKEIGFAVALSAPAEGSLMPTLGIGIKGTTLTPQTVLNLTSPVYTVAAESAVVDLVADFSTENGGTVTVEAQVTNPDGTLGEWGPLALQIGRKFNAIQFRATLTAPQIGVSVAKLSQVTLRYRSGDDIISGVGTAELVTVTRDWHDGIQDSRITIRHAILVDASISAQCAIRGKTKIVQGEQIGTGTGERAVYSLANNDGIQFDSMAVYVNGTRVMAGWELNTEVGRITMTAPVGSAITVDYIHGWTEEVWVEMTPTGTIRTPEYEQSEFKHLVPDPEDERSICAVKISLGLTDGRAEGESLGTGTGKSQVYYLDHVVKDGSIEVYADGELLPPANWILLDGEKSIEIAAQEGSILTASYDWVSETPTVDKFIAVFG